MSGQTVLDPAAIQALVDLGDGPAFAIEVIGLFLDEAPRQRTAAEQALARADAPALREAAHALKSAAANLGLHDVSASAKALEAVARTGDASAAGPLVARVAQALTHATLALEEESRRLAGA